MEALKLDSETMRKLPLNFNNVVVPMPLSLSSGSS